MIDSRKPTAPSGAPELHDARSQGDAPSGSEVNGRDDDSPDGDSRRGGASDGNESGMDLSSFRAKVDSYNGPLDLLLYLIKKDEIDLFDIPLARVVDQYRLYLDLLKEIDPNVCGEFLVLAAQLIEIKSKRLLPAAVVDEDGGEVEDPRLDLVRQLLEFKKYKERAMLLENRFEEYRRRYHRPYKAIPDLNLDDLGALSLGKVSVWDLLTAFQRVQFALGSRGPHRVFLKERPLSEYVARIETVLSEADDRATGFEELFEGAVNREDAIGLFLGILELCKQYRLVVEQEDLFGRIVVRLRDAAETERFKSADAAEIGPDGEIDPAEAQLVRGEGAEARAVAIETSSDDDEANAPERDEPGKGRAE
ncbi:MAG: segregation/condensation protein A [Planctomycetes bacterium]|nr:segregation/condensation protein A [Planctomycetota bacterium]